MILTGRIQIIFGPMFSGKTTELIRRIKRFNFANKKCLVIKYSRDTRYNTKEVETGQLFTHDRQNYEAYPCTELNKARIHAQEFDVIGIDEGQFFPDVASFSEELANQGKVVIISALDGTFQRKPWPSMIELISKAEDITKLNAVCMVCYQDGAFSKRIVPDDTVELIGGSDKYISVCRNCYNNDQPIGTNYIASAPPTNTTAGEKN
eukprot:gene3891-4857_t